MVLELAADPRQNRLLAALPDPEWARWMPRLEPVDMPLGRVLYESGGYRSETWHRRAGWRLRAED